MTSKYGIPWDLIGCIVLFLIGIAVAGMGAVFHGFNGFLRDKVIIAIGLALVVVAIVLLVL